MYHGICIPQIGEILLYWEDQCRLPIYILPKDTLKVSHCLYHRNISFGNITYFWTYLPYLYTSYIISWKSSGSMYIFIQHFPYILNNYLRYSIGISYGIIPYKIGQDPHLSNKDHLYTIYKYTHEDQCRLPL